MQLKIKLKPGATLPVYQTSGSAGMDLHAYIASSIRISPGQRFFVPTGLSMAIPQGFEGHIRPRSGLAGKFGVTTLAGTIDSDFRGEVLVGLINLGDADIVIESGMRMAQIVFSPVVQADCVIVDTLDETSRGAGGFGSTGV